MSPQVSYHLTVLLLSARSSITASFSSLFWLYKNVTVLYLLSTKQTTLADEHSS